MDWEVLVFFSKAHTFLESITLPECTFFEIRLFHALIRTIGRWFYLSASARASPPMTQWIMKLSTRHWEWWQGSLHSALVSGAEISLSAFDLSAIHLVALCFLGAPICSTHAFFIINCRPHLPLNHWCKNSLVFPKCYTEYCLEGKTYRMLVPLANF